MSVELRHLRALVAVVEEGTFTDAAIALGISQASVSRSVRTLEDALGATMLRRTTREVALTATGSLVVAHARRALAEVTAMERAAAEATDEIRIGYAWSALGRHTIDVQRRWAAEQHGSTLLFVQSQTRLSGLTDGTADIAVLRTPIDDPRFRVVIVGTETRYGAMAADDPLARRRSLTLADFTDRTLAIDIVTGTTSIDLWPEAARPTRTRATQAFEDWLTLVAAGQAVGMSSEATANQHPHPGIVYRPMRDAPPVTVSLAWRKDDPPAHAMALARLIRQAYSRT